MLRGAKDIAADSKGHQLPEPKPCKIINLIPELSQITYSGTYSRTGRISMTNAEILQTAHTVVGAHIGMAVANMEQAIKMLEESNKEIKDLGTYSRIKTLKEQVAELEFLARLFLATRFAPKNKSPQATNSSQCCNCDGSGKVVADHTEVDCPVCDGSGTIT